MSEIVKYVDVGIANEEDCQKALGIVLEAGAWEQDIQVGTLQSRKISGALRKSA